MSATLKSPLLPTCGTLRSIEEIAPDNFLYRFKFTDKTLSSCMPGQFVQLWLPGVGESAISICSGKTGDTLELLIRRVGRVTTSAAKMTEGQIVGLRGPFGRGFPVEHFRGKSVCMVAGGCGVAPLRGLWQYLLDHRCDYDRLTLVYGMRRPSDMLFAREFKEMAKRKDIDLLLSSENLPPEDKTVVPMQHGMVTAVLHSAPLAPDYQIAVCGPPVMYKFVVRDLRRRGVPDENMWLSLERHMKCGIGKCGHCFVSGKLSCQCGPVFRLDELKGLPEAIECE